MEIILLVVVGLFLLYFWVKSLFTGAQRKAVSEEVKGLFVDQLRSSRVGVKTSMAERLVESKKVIDDLGLDKKSLEAHKNLLDAI